MNDEDFFRLLVAAYAAGGHSPVDALRQARITLELEHEFRPEEQLDEWGEESPA